MTENRPGLSAVAYRVGTYGSFRRAMLEQLARMPELAGLTTRRSDDHAITLLELWAAVADVLTFYQERYANEAWLRPATQRESIARLARLIDYELRAGVAPGALLAFTADAGTTVRMAAGSRVMSVPAQDEQPQTYETLEDMVADGRLNRLRILPPPVGANPLAKGALEAWLEPGPASVGLAPGDRLALVRTGATGAVEELTVREVGARDDRLRLAWTVPIELDGWDVTTAAYELGRVFRVFGHNAPPTTMTPTTDATVAGGVRWTLATTPTNHPDGSTLALDGRYEAVKPGTRLLLAVAAGPVRLLTVTAVGQTNETVGPLTDTVTSVDVEPALPAAFDRRTAVVHEVVGGPIRFWGYDYPTTLTGSTALVPARLLGDGRVEVGRTIVRDELQDGVALAPAEIAPGRVALLVGEGGAAIPATILSARATGAEVGVATTPADATTAAELGLDARSASATTALLSGALAASLTRTTGELAVGDVAPVSVTLTLGANETVSADAIAPVLEQAIVQAATTPELAAARVRAVNGRLLVVPGVPGAALRVTATAEDPTTAVELGLDPDRSSVVSALLSGRLPAPLTLSGAARELAVTIGPLATRTVTLATAPTTRAAARAALEAALRDIGDTPAFAHAQVLRLDDRLLLTPGPLGAAVAEYLALELRTDEPVALASDSSALLGNVAHAGHGETVRDEPIGDGNAAVAWQRFSLKRAPLTLTPAATPEGVASTLSVLVNGVHWSEVPSLLGQPGDAQVYETRQDDAGGTVVQFGDGTRGATPPTGRANIRATYRVGQGLAGRVGAGVLTTALDRPPGLLAVTNPRGAEGGADPEAVDDARANAPHTVRTFGRAVSLRDVEDLVTASGEVAKAQATALGLAIHVTVAAQGGGSLSADSLLRLHAALDVARDPNVELQLHDAVPVPVRVRATIDVDPSHVRADVLAAARTALLERLAFDAVGLAEPVAVSDLFRVLQEVPGVRSADIDELAFKSATDLDRRGVLVLADGTAAPVQPRLRVFAARPDPAHPGTVLAAEYPSVEAPDQDVTLVATGGLA